MLLAASSWRLCVSVVAVCLAASAVAGDHVSNCSVAWVGGIAWVPGQASIVAENNASGIAMHWRRETHAEACRRAGLVTTQRVVVLPHTVLQFTRPPPAHTHNLSTAGVTGGGSINIATSWASFASPWNGATAARIASDLGGALWPAHASVGVPTDDVWGREWWHSNYTIPPGSSSIRVPGLAGCCVPALWCLQAPASAGASPISPAWATLSNATRRNVTWPPAKRVCFSHSFGGRWYVNQGWLPSAPFAAPVFTCRHGVGATLDAGTGAIAETFSANTSHGLVVVGRAGPEAPNADALPPPSVSAVEPATGPVGTKVMIRGHVSAIVCVGVRSCADRAVHIGTAFRQGQLCRVCVCGWHALHRRDTVPRHVRAVSIHRPVRPWVHMCQLQHCGADVPAAVLRRLFMPLWNDVSSLWFVVGAIPVSASDRVRVVRTVPRYKSRLQHPSTQRHLRGLG